MTSEQFLSAIAMLQEKGVITNGRGWKVDLCRILNMTPETITSFTKDGTRQKQTDYAIAAIVAGIPAYPGQGKGVFIHVGKVETMAKNISHSWLANT